MNRQKILILCLGTVLGILPAAVADDAPPPPPPAGGSESLPPPPPPEHGHRSERMIKALNLSPDQETKWKAVDQQEKDAMQAVHHDASLTKEQKWAKMGDVRKSFESQHRALLNSDQQTKFDEILAKMRERMQHRHDQEGAPPPPPAASDSSTGK
ncbi:MAG TPA: hypothetical protein VGM73_01760 [Candidatus Didemnitutus sp.]